MAPANNGTGQHRHDDHVEAAYILSLRGADAGTTIGPCGDEDGHRSDRNTSTHLRLRLCLILFCHPAVFLSSRVLKKGNLSAMDE
jgi:hypothetical protein